MTFYIVTLYNDKGDGLHRAFVSCDGSPNDAIGQAFTDYKQRGLTNDVIGTFVRATYLH